MAQKTRTILLRQGDEDAELQVQLPVNPKKIVIYQPQNTISYQTIRGETIHAACGTGLTEVTLETFLPGEDSRFYQGTAPEKALQLLTR